MDTQTNNQESSCNHPDIAVSLESRDPVSATMITEYSHSLHANVNDIPKIANTNTQEINNKETQVEGLTSNIDNDEADTLGNLETCENEVLVNNNRENHEIEDKTIVDDRVKSNDHSNNDRVKDKVYTEHEIKEKAITEEKEDIHVSCDNEVKNIAKTKTIDEERSPNSTGNDQLDDKTLVDLITDNAEEIKVNNRDAETHIGDNEFSEEHRSNDEGADKTIGDKKDIAEEAGNGEPELSADYLSKRVKVDD